MKGLGELRMQAAPRRAPAKRRGREPRKRPRARSRSSVGHETETGDRAELVNLPRTPPAGATCSPAPRPESVQGASTSTSASSRRMRREAEQAQVVVVNHHLFFADLALRTAERGGFGGAIPPYDAVIFDEAHQIESVATDSSACASRPRASTRSSAMRAAACSQRDHVAIDAASTVDTGALLRAMAGCGAAPSGSAIAAARCARSEWRRSRRMLGDGDSTERALRRARTSMRRDPRALGDSATANERDEAIAILARRDGDLRSGPRRASMRRARPKSGTRSR